MSTTEEAFLSDIRASPDDDGVRLIYADWLQENGQPERAEFIHVQVELARIDPTDDRYPELHLRQLQLLAEHEREWLGPWADRLVRWRFQRGLLHEVDIQPEPFVAAGADLFARHPVHTVAFVDGWGMSLAPEAIQRVLAAPHCALVRGLELSGCRPHDGMFGMFCGNVQTSAWLAGLAGASHVTRLEVLNVPGGTRQGRGQIEREALAAFCSAAHLASLRSLDFSDAYSVDGPDAMVMVCELLANATFASGLRRLDLAQCTLTDDALDRLTASPGLRNLEAVDLTSCDAIGPAALRAFLASRPAGRLTELGLPYGLDLRELGESWPGLADVQDLTLAGSTRRQGERGIHYTDGRVVRWTPGRDVAPDDWLGLFLSPQLHPNRLQVCAETIPDDAIAELFRRDWLAGLRTLTLITSQWQRSPDRDVLAVLLDRDMPRLHEVSITGLDALPRRLAAWPVLPHLTCFPIGMEEGFAAWLLSKAPLTVRLPRIDLDERCGTAAALRALAASPWARGVSHLGFGSNGLTPARVACLAAAPFARHLEALHLGSEHGKQTLAALQAIADDRNFPRLRDVVVGSNTIEGGIEVLRRRFGPRLRVWADC